MFLDDAPRPGHALIGSLRRRRFLCLSLLLHAMALAALACLAGHRNVLDQRERQRELIETGSRLTQQARLERRVQDMARIKSMLEQSVAAGDARQAPAAAQEGDVRFDAHAKTPQDLLRQASELARKIDKIEHDIEAQRLVKLLGIPKNKALEQIAQARKLQQAHAGKTLHDVDAAARIAQLEAQARAVLERRRRQLTEQRDGTRLTASAARGTGGTSPSGAGRHGAASHGGADAQGGLVGSGNGPGKGPGSGQGSGPGNGITGNMQGSSLLERMAGFANPDLPDRATEAYTAGGLRAFFDRGIGHIPDVGAGPVVKGAGRILGRGGPYANRIHVNAWYLIGPFEGRHGEGLFTNDRHPPEQAVALDAVYRGKDGRLLKWEYIDAVSYPLIPPDRAEDAVYYGYTELMVDADQDLTAWIGADDDAQLWLNDLLVWRGGNVDKQWFFGQVYETVNTGVRNMNLSEGKRVLHFKKGRNKLFFKLSNGPTRLFFSLVLTK
ncbi:cell envelope integrity protein TolA [Massilia forsythiae]|uniref:Cell envelope integrity protein TolA n=1 Tax=Massilia forsythiae TaxID=2728020 RepID=A0A7Z2VVK1_9BURK|nr:cell envelope integrity protein TolA [Massilia forsythiae]QJD99973.1 cell envelope integrity protein TolA [Massilia forsythiae]